MLLCWSASGAVRCFQRNLHVTVGKKKQQNLESVILDLSKYWIWWIKCEEMSIHSCCLKESKPNTRDWWFFLSRSPSTPELSADELPDDIANEITDIPHDLELNQEDFSDVLPRLPDDLQDFDFFEGIVLFHSMLVWTQSVNWRNKYFWSMHFEGQFAFPERQ